MYEEITDYLILIKFNNNNNIFMSIILYMCVYKTCTYTANSRLYYDAISSCTAGANGKCRTKFYHRKSCDVM